MVTFSYWGYVIPGVIIPVLFVTLTLLLASFVSKRLATDRHGPIAIISPLLLWGSCTIVFLATIGVWFKAPLSLVLEPDTPLQKTVGRVTAVNDAPELPIYYSPDSKILHSAMYITVNGDDYYLPYCHVDVGSLIELIWTGDMRVVYNVDDTVSESSPIGTTLISEPDEQDNYERSRDSNGIFIARTFLILFIAVVVLQYLLGSKIACWLQEKDRTYRKGIIPSRIGLIHFAFTFLPFTGMIAGIAISGFPEAVVILALGTVVIVYILIKKQATSLTLSCGRIIYKELYRTLTFAISDLKEIAWVQSRIPGNRCLRITLQNSFVLTFEQENFWGLENMYCRLQRKLQTNHQHRTEELNRTGEGPLS